MVAHMKTTIDIADDLLEKAKSRASAEKKTLRVVIEEALRIRLSEGPPQRFQLRRHVFRGNGMQSGMSEGNWERLRDLIYRLE
jgi:hypothetical protein